MKNRHILTYKVRKFVYCIVAYVLMYLLNNGYKVIVYVV